MALSVGKCREIPLLRGMTAFSKRNMTTGDSSQIPDLTCRPSDVLFCILERPSLWGLEAVHVEYVACLASAVHWDLGVASFVSSQWQSVPFWTPKTWGHLSVAGKQPEGRTGSPTWKRGWGSESRAIRTFPSRGASKGRGTPASIYEARDVDQLRLEPSRPVGCSVFSARR